MISKTWGGLAISISYGPRNAWRTLRSFRGRAWTRIQNLNEEVEAGREVAKTEPRGGG